jgi:hypothetical protein
MKDFDAHFLSCLVAVLLVASICDGQEHQGVVLDASMNHIIVSGGMTPENIAAGERDPRIRQLLRLQARAEERRGIGTIPTIAGDFGIFSATIPPPSSMAIQGQTTQVNANRKIDWSVNLGAGHVAPHQFAAKYGFNLNAADCVNDWVVYGLNVPGVTGGQANDEAQASNMYFSTLAVVSVGSCLNARCAVKLSQLDLQ